MRVIGDLSVVYEICNFSWTLTIREIVPIRRKDYIKYQEERVSCPSPPKKGFQKAYVAVTITSLKPQEKMKVEVTCDELIVLRN